MTLKTMTTIGLTSVLAYQVYRKRHQIKETLVAMQTSKKLSRPMLIGLRQISPSFKRRLERFKQQEQN